MSVRLSLLGSPALCVSGGLEALPLELPASLLYYLAYRGDWVARRELAFLYRSDVPEVTALNYLRKLVYRARRLPWAIGLEVTPERLRWQVDTDVAVFTGAVSAGDLAAALEPYRGPFLAGLELPAAPAYMAWLDLERADLGRQWAGALRGRAQTLSRVGESAAALELLGQLARHDPLDEDTLQAQLELLARCERTGEALRLFEAFRARLHDDLGAEPLEATQTLVDSLRRAPPSRRAIAELPADTTRFVGREAELAALHERFSKPACRLVTLVGLGGAGKTRLALAYGRAHREAYRDGVVFAGLAGASTPDSVLATLAEALGLTFAGSSEPADQLAAFLRGRQLLFILDNFEHLRADAPLLETFLEAAPELHLLVTSRVALELRGETLLDLGGLALPDPDSAEVSGFDAVALFLNRAERASGQFVRSSETLAAVAEIARRVGGLPLALELSASWTRTLGVSDIVRLLDDTPALLEAPLAHVPERQRSITRVFDESFGQLSEQERAALLRLSVFEGGFDLRAAERVAGAGLGVLMSLINRALVGRRGENRYALHELLRQYLAARLEPETRAEVERAHSHYFLEQLADHEAALSGPAPQRVRAELLADTDNLRAAYRAALHREQWPLVERAFPGLNRLLFSSGLFKVMEQLFGHLLTLLADLGENETGRVLKVQARLGLARARTHLGRADGDDLKALRDDLAAYRDTPGEAAAYAEALFLLGRNLCERGHLAEGGALFDEGLKVIGGQEPLAVELDLLEGVAMVRWSQGDYEGAVAVVRRWLEHARTLGDAAAIVTASQTLANRLKYIGDPAKERGELIRSALALQNEVGPYPQAGLLNDHALDLLEQGDAAEAEAMLRTCLDLAARTGDRYENATIAYNLARALREQGRYDEATKMFETSLEFARFGSLQYAGLAETERLQGRYAEARAYLLEALTVYRKQPHAVMQVLEALVALARLYADEGQTREAFKLVSFIRAFEGSGHQQKRAAEPLYLELKASLGASDQALPKALEPYLDEHIGRLQRAAT